MNTTVPLIHLDLPTPTAKSGRVAVRRLTDFGSAGDEARQVHARVIRYNDKTSRRPCSTCTRDRPGSRPTRSLRNRLSRVSTWETLTTDS